MRICAPRSMLSPRRCKLRTPRRVNSFFLRPTLCIPLPSTRAFQHCLPMGPILPSLAPLVDAITPMPRSRPQFGKLRMERATLCKANSMATLDLPTSPLTVYNTIVQTSHLHVPSLSVLVVLERRFRAAPSPLARLVLARVIWGPFTAAVALLHLLRLLRLLRPLHLQAAAFYTPPSSSRMLLYSLYC